MRDHEQITYFASYDHRGKSQKFGIRAKDRSQHVYVIGKTGMGKSTLLENMAVQDIQNGNGVAFIDPHGSTAEKLLDYVPEERVQDVVYFAPFDMEYPISFNVMEDVGYDKRHLVVNNLMSAFKKIWVDAWSARMEYLLTNALLALIEYPGATLLSVNRMFVDKPFRKKVLEYVTDPVVKSFWEEEFAKYTDRYTQEATPAIQNKVGQFLSNPLVRNIVGQTTSSFDIRELMDEKKILIMNLSKGRMGDVNARLLGSMLIIKIYLAAMSRADTSSQELQKLPPFYFFVDEFQSFANETFADILSEARKYKLALTITHQYVGQMSDEVRDAIFGNVGTMVTFRIGAEDAEMFEKEFSPTFTVEDMVNLGAYQIYLKLMIDGVASKPFSAKTLPPIVPPEESYRDQIIEHSRKTYSQTREVIEAAIREGQAPVADTAPAKPSGTSEYGGRQKDSGHGKDQFGPRDQGRQPEKGQREQRERGSAPVQQNERKSAPPAPAKEKTHKPFASVLSHAHPQQEKSGASPKKNDSGAPQSDGKKEKENIPHERTINANTPKEKEGSVPLKFLKQQTTEKKSPEHLKALRSALSETLQDHGEKQNVSSSDSTSAEPNKFRRQDNTQQERNTGAQNTRKQEKRSAAPKKQVPEKKLQSQHEPLSNTKHASRSKSDTRQRRPIAEIPQDQLENILRVDGDEDAAGGKK